MLYFKFLNGEITYNLLHRVIKIAMSESVEGVVLPCQTDRRHTPIL